MELVFPIEDERLRERAFSILDLMLRAQHKTPGSCSRTTSYVHIDRRESLPSTASVNFSRLAAEALHALEEQDLSKPLRPVPIPIEEAQKK